LDQHARQVHPNNPRYADWGGRGITVCERWNSFENFLADMGGKPSPEHEIDRIDNDGPYCKENCRWATKIEQANNKRDNRPLTLRDRTQTIAQWAREYSIDPKKLWHYVVVKHWHPELIRRLLEIHRERAAASARR
jgi:hypothetical protein